MASIPVQQSQHSVAQPQVLVRMIIELISVFCLMEGRRLRRAGLSAQKARRKRRPYTEETSHYQKLGCVHGHRPPHNSISSFPRSGQFGSLSNCAISSLPNARTPASSSPFADSNNRWNRVTTTDATPATACAVAMILLRKIPSPKVRLSG